MPKDRIRESLERLREEVHTAEFREHGVREKLERLIADLEARVAASEDAPPSAEEDEGLMENLREAIGQVEVEYPRATTLLNQIMTALGNIGI